MGPRGWRSQYQTAQWTPEEEFQCWSLHSTEPEDTNEQEKECVRKTGCDWTFSTWSSLCTMCIMLALSSLIFTQYSLLLRVHRPCKGSQLLHHKLPSAWSLYKLMTYIHEVGESLHGRRGWGGVLCGSRSLPQSTQLIHGHPAVTHQAAQASAFIERNSESTWSSMNLTLRLLPGTSAPIGLKSRVSPITRRTDAKQQTTCGHN